MTHPLPAPRQRETAPGVSRRVFLTSLGIALALFAGMFAITLVTAQNIVDDATDGLCLLVRDTPDSVALARDIRQKYDCPAYRAADSLRTASPSSTSLSTGVTASASSSRPATTSATPRSSGVTGTGPVQRPTSAPTRTTIRTQPREQGQPPATRTVTRAGPTRVQPVPSTTSPGVLGSLCRLVGIKVTCDSLGLN